MDPSDFDIDRHLIPFIPSVTPLKKRVKRDPEELSPEKVWKPSCQSKRSERGETSRFIHQEILSGEG